LKRSRAVGHFFGASKPFTGRVGRSGRRDARYGHFVVYGDAQGYRDELDALRAEVRKTHDQ